MFSSDDLFCVYVFYFSGIMRTIVKSKADFRRRFFNCPNARTTKIDMLVSSYAVVFYKLRLRAYAERRKSGSGSMGENKKSLISRLE